MQNKKDCLNNQNERISIEYRVIKRNYDLKIRLIDEKDSLKYEFVRIVNKKKKKNSLRWKRNISGEKMNKIKMGESLRHFVVF